jgi:hypothetical protein
MGPDMELRQMRAIEAMDALEALFESLPPGSGVESCHVAILISLAGEAVRGACALPMRARSVNDA